MTVVNTPGGSLNYMLLETTMEQQWKFLLKIVQTIPGGPLLMIKAGSTYVIYRPQDKTMQHSCSQCGRDTLDINWTFQYCRRSILQS